MFLYVNIMNMYVTYICANTYFSSSSATSATRAVPRSMMMWWPSSKVRITFAGWQRGGR